jgi:hypothetical protein
MFRFLTTVIDADTTSPCRYLHDNIDAADEGEARRIALQKAMNAQPSEWTDESLGVEGDVDGFYGDVGETRDGKKIVGLPPYYWHRTQG